MSKKEQVKAPVTLLPNPHAWMSLPATSKAIPPPRRETIREWYSRKTGWAVKAVVFLTTCSVLTMCLMWASASLPTLQRLQTFNGALTIPLIGGIWIFGFIYLFLTPSREASFRGQESLEEGVEIIREVVAQKAGPGIEIWTRIGARLEQELPSLLQRAAQVFEDVSAAAKRLEGAAADNGKFMEDARPAIEALKKIESRCETELATGFFEEIRAAAKGVKAFAVPPDATEPDFNHALTSIRKAKTSPVDGRMA